jgi:hypothetical protein
VFFAYFLNRPNPSMEPDGKRGQFSRRDSGDITCTPKRAKAEVTVPVALLVYSLLLIGVSEKKE